VLIVATNAYTGNFSKTLMPAIAHEVMPVLSWQMATQPLPETARQTIIPGRQAMSDTDGELYFARYDARNRLVTGGAAIGPGDKAERSRPLSPTASSAVAADRPARIRLRLERLCRNDHGFPSAHSSARARRLWLDRPATAERWRLRWRSAMDYPRPCGVFRKRISRCRSQILRRSSRMDCWAGSRPDVDGLPAA